MGKASTFVCAPGRVLAVACALASLTITACAAPPFAEADGVVVFETEDFSTHVTHGNEHQWQLMNTIGGYSGTGYMAALPDINTNLNTTWTNTSPELDYAVNFTDTGTYYVWVRGYATGGSDDSLHGGLDGATSGASHMAFSAYNAWQWTKTTMLPGDATVAVGTPGLHTFNLWMREDGMRVDRVLLTTTTGFSPTVGNAWHIPNSVEPAGPSGMRTPLSAIYSNTAVVIFSGNQFAGGGTLGNQLGNGSAIFYKRSTDTNWSSVPLYFSGIGGPNNQNKYFSNAIPAKVFSAGDTVQYYLRIPYSDHLPTFLYGTAGQSLATENETTAQASPFSYTVQDPAAPPPQAFASPEDWRDLTIYQIITDRFYDGDPANNTANPDGTYNASNGKTINGGDHKGIELKLDYIKALGASAIWISPVVRCVKGAYHGYHAQDFLQVDPHWGTFADLTNMIAAAHARGIYVILDIVCNHTGDLVDSTDAGWATFKYAPDGYNLRYKDPTKRFAWPFDTNGTTSLSAIFHNNGNIQNYGDNTQLTQGQLNDHPDFRTESTYIRTNMAHVYAYWITEAGFDGFRIDTAKHVEHGFWRTWCPLIRQAAATVGKTNFFTFGEVLDGSDAYCGSFTGTKSGGAYEEDSVLDYPGWFKVNSVFANASGNTKQLEDHYNAIAGNYDPYAQMRLVTFLDNHDQQRFLYTNSANNNTNRLNVGLVWLLTSRGIPCLYYGTEQNFNGGTDPNNREDMFDGGFEQGPSLGDNFNMTKGGFVLVAKLNNFRRNHVALRRGSHVNLWNNPNGPGLFAYARRYSNEEVVVVFNTAGSSQTLPNRSTIYNAGTVLVNLLNTNELITVVDGATGLPSIPVPATSAKIFVARSLQKPLDPLVTGQTPAHDLVNVSPGSAITLAFSKPMNTGAVQQAFSVTPPVGGTFAWNAARDQVTFTPNVPGLAGATSIVVRVGTNAVDAVSTNGLYAPFETFFRTSASSFTDSVPPAVAIVQPAGGVTTSGVVALAGTASDNASVLKVEVRLDGGDWVAATGTTAWSVALDSANFLNGSHTVSARSTDSSGNLSTQANLIVRFFNVPGAFERRVSAGGAGDATNCDAAVWLRDRAYVPGDFGYAGGTNALVASAISNVCADGQVLYQRERFSTPAGTLRYLFDCPEGVYETTLLECETFFTDVGQRRFDVHIQNDRVLTNFDIFAAAGGMNQPLSLAFTSTVTDAQLELHFVPQTDNARVSAIQVRRIGDVDTDGDGLPNWWTLGWFDHATGQDGDGSLADDDPDGDGVGNRGEYVAKTSPLDPDLFLRIEDLAAAAGAAIFLPSVSGRLYRLERKDELLGTDDWTTVETAVPGIDSVLTLTDTHASDHGVYRVRVSAP